MSSRSNGVTKVVLILTMISCVSLVARELGLLDPRRERGTAGGVRATSLASSSAATAMFSAARVNSG